MKFMSAVDLLENRAKIIKFMSALDLLANRAKIIVSTVIRTKQSENLAANKQSENYYVYECYRVVGKYREKIIKFMGDIDL